MPSLFKLNTSHKPGQTVQKFDTLIWTERYTAAGDFKIICLDDVSILTALPTGVLISHTDTNQVMIVENHWIKRNKEKKLEVTVSGRSFETFAEERVTNGTRQGLYDTSVDNVAITETFASAPAENVARDLLRYSLESPYANADDAVANVSIKLVIREPDAPMAHVIKRGDVYKQVLELLGIANAGVKVVRPNGTQNTLDLVVYDGLDLTLGPQAVIFYAQNDDLVEPEYFWSIKGYKNYAQISTHTDARLYRHRDITANLQGLDRRIIYVEADDLEGSYTPGTSTDVVAGRGQSELDAHKKVALLSAKVSETAKPKFKIHYDVGDLVKAFGEFATAQNMRVTEHILTVDKDGIRGYPSLSAV